MLSISLPKKPKVIEYDKNAHRAFIEIRELYPGYGATVGNALRRVLYSSLPGAAVTSVKISGVSHEFSTIGGVMEDVLEISLNVKQIRLNLHGDEPQTMILKAKGKKEVTAKDIDAPSQVEILNKDVHILTLTSPKSSIEMELQVEQGLGYVQVDQDEKDKKEIGVVRLDAVFSPVKRVNFEVENMRVGDKTDYNRLVLDITTDGTVSPQDAFVNATKVMLEHFNLFMSLSDEKTAKTAGKKKQTKDNKKTAKKK